jgi:hypothetical protein
VRLEIHRRGDQHVRIGHERACDEALIRDLTATDDEIYEVPVGVGLLQNLNKHFDIGARFSTRSLAILLNIRS